MVGAQQKFDHSLRLRVFKLEYQVICCGRDLRLFNFLCKFKCRIELTAWRHFNSDSAWDVVVHVMEQIIPTLNNT